MIVAIDQIQVGKRLRGLREASVTELMDSIASLGLQNPISVATGVAKRDGDADAVSFALVAGAHRLEACRRLGLAEIEARIVQMSDDERLLWEIDENLMRAELTELERGEHLKSRKEVYLRLHPRTDHGANREPSGKFFHSDSPSFAVDTADKIGVTDRTVRQSIRRVEKIDAKVRDRIRDLPEIADSGVELDALAAMDDAHQRRAVAMVEAGTAGSIRDAKRVIEAPPRVTTQSHFKEAEIARQKRREAFIKAWNALDEDDREWALAQIDIPVADNARATA